MNALKFILISVFFLQCCLVLKGQTNIYQHTFDFPKSIVGQCYTICIKEKNNLKIEEKVFLKENLLRFSPMAYTYQKKIRRKILKFGVKKRKSDTTSIEGDEKKKKQITYSNPNVLSYYPPYHPIEKRWVLKPSEENCLSIPSEDCMTWCLEDNRLEFRRFDLNIHPEESMPNNRPKGWYVDFDDKLSPHEEWIIPPVVQDYEYFEEVAPPSQALISLKSDVLSKEEMAQSVEEGLTTWVRTSPCLEYGNLWGEIQKSLELKGYKIPQIIRDVRKQRDSLEAITHAYLHTKGWKGKHLDYDALDLLGINFYEKDTLSVFSDSTSNEQSLLFVTPIPPFNVSCSDALVTYPYLKPESPLLTHCSNLKTAIVNELQFPEVTFDTIYQKIWTRKGVKIFKENRLKRKDKKQIRWINKSASYKLYNAYQYRQFDDRTCWESCVHYFDQALIVKYFEEPAKFQSVAIEVLDEGMIPMNCMVDTVLQENEVWIFPPKFTTIPFYRQRTSKIKISNLTVPSEEINFYQNLLKQYRYDWICIQRPCCSKPKLPLIPSLEQKLKERGYYKGKILGVLSDELKEAIVKFQKDNKLPIGQVNIETLRALGISQ